MRVPIPSDRAQKIFDTNGKVYGLLIQNLSGTDVFTSFQSASELDKVNETSGQPFQGAKWTAGMLTPTPVGRFNGVIYGRAPVNTELEIDWFEVECTCAG